MSPKSRISTGCNAQDVRHCLSQYEIQLVPYFETFAMALASITIVMFMTIGFSNNLAQEIPGPVEKSRVEVLWQNL